MKKRIMLSACLMAGMVFGSPANSEVTPNPTDTDFTHNVFTLSNPQDTQPTSGSYVILAEIDKTANSWTYAPIYYDFTINTTEYGTGSPSTPYIAKIPPNENITITVNGVSNGRMDNPSSVSDKIFFGKSNGEGGAVYNSEHTTTGISNSIFVSNNSTGAGGAISNNGDETFSNTIMGDITDSIFISNSAGSSGGAIYSDGYDMYDAGVVTKMGKITGSTFISNSATYDGGAINAGGDEFSGISASTFISNSTPYDGGAIYNYVTMTNGISDSTFISNTARDGGAIYSAEGDVNITDSAFVSNTATIKGGAIYNYTYATLSIKDSAFVSNNAPRSYYGSNGGAIYNQGTISDIKNSTFISNSAGDNGGAIMYQSGTIGNIVNSTFISNSSTSGAGGAIYSFNKDLMITSDNGTTLFKDNTAGGESNAIYMNSYYGPTTLTFDLKNSGKTYMYDGIDGANEYNVVITGTDKTADTFYLFNDINNAGTVSMGGVELNTINNDIHTYNFNTLNLASDINMAVDVDLAAEKMDQITASTYNLNGNNINVVGMNLLTDAVDPDTLTSVPFADDDLKANVTTSITQVGDGTSNPYQTTAFAPIYKYDVSYDPSNGNFEFVRSSGGGSDSYNPAVLAAPVAAQAGAMASQWNSYDQAFLNLDMNMLFTREARRAMKLQNKYASISTPKVFSETYLPERDMAAWARPYTSFETVHLRKGPHVNNTMYGMYFGGDSEMYELKHNWDFQYSVYAGYNGSRQSYNDVTILQNGGTLGTTGIFYHDNFFTGLTVNVGAGVANADTMYGHEDFAMLSTGVASKTGYNWELAKGRFIIQPSWLMSYSFVNTFDYTNAAGVRISSDPLHAIQLAPQLKFIGNLPRGWQPYASVQMVWNIMDEAKFKANDVSLPHLSMGPYLQYGVGVQKRWGDRFTGFFQTMFRNGSRTGVAFTLGFRWALGSQRDNKTGFGHSSTRTVIK